MCVPAACRWLISAQASGCIDFVPPRSKIPAELQRLVKTIAAKKKHDFDPKAFLATIDEGRNIVLVPGKQTITRGDGADTVFYIQKGNVRLTVVSEKGKEATIAILNLSTVSLDA
jgi:CRP-like cAMP-binding protein